MSERKCRGAGSPAEAYGFCREVRKILKVLGLGDLHRVGILWRLFGSRSMAGPGFLDRPVKESEPHSRNSHHTAAVDLDHRYESAVICIFPNRESGT